MNSFNSSIGNTLISLEFIKNIWKSTFDAVFLSSWKFLMSCCYKLKCQNGHFPKEIVCKSDFSSDVTSTRDIFRFAKPFSKTFLLPWFQGQTGHFRIINDDKCCLVELHLENCHFWSPSFESNFWAAVSIASRTVLFGDKCLVVEISRELLGQIKTSHLSSLQSLKLESPKCTKALFIYQLWNNPSTRCHCAHWPEKKRKLIDFN